MKTFKNITRRLVLTWYSHSFLGEMKWNLPGQSMPLYVELVFSFKSRGGCPYMLLYLRMAYLTLHPDDYDF